MSKHRRTWLLAVVLVPTALVGMALRYGPSASPLPALAAAPLEVVFARSDLDVQRSIEPGAAHFYELALEAGRFLHVEVEQRGSDVQVELLDSRGSSLIKVDTPTGNQSSEHLHAVTGDPGSYTLVISAFESNQAPGAYLAQITEERPAKSRDRQSAEAEKAYFDARALAKGSPQGEAPEAAVEGFGAAVEIWKTLGERRRQADALYELGMIHRWAGRKREAISCHERSLELWTQPADRRDRAIAFNELGLIWLELGEPIKAQHEFEQALKLFRELGVDADAEGVLMNLGRLHSRRGRPLEALELLTPAAYFWRQRGERLRLVDTLNLIGEVYSRLGNARLALDHHREALELLDPKSERAKRAETLGFTGKALLEANDLEGAATTYEEIVALEQKRGEETGIAIGWTGLGIVEERRGNLHRSLELYQKALTIFDDQGLARTRAPLLNNLARNHLALDRPEQALELHQQALKLYQQLDDHEGQAASLEGLAQTYRQLQQTGLALHSAGAAVVHFERVLEAGQAPAARSDVSLPYLASHQGVFDLYVELLMEQHRREPGAGYDALALAASEQARARQLLEMLAEDPERLREGAGHELFARQRALQEEINTADADLRRRRAHEPERALQEAERALRRRLIDYHDLAQQIREQSPWHASLHQPRPLALSEIQRLLDDETVFLEYHLGEEHSYLWRVDRKGLESYVLPPRADLEKLARRAYVRLMKSDQITHRVPAEQALAELAAVLLSPVGKKLTARRLVIVASGALEYIPFAVLPLPETPRHRLIEAHEVVSLPSASVLAVLREQISNRPSPEGLLAILADPVFGPDDERLDRLDREAEPLGIDTHSFSRLPNTHREAEAILTLAERLGPILEAQGFEAHRGLVRSGRLADYRILHFATHGVLDAEHPELSSLVLSRYDSEGQLRNGRLPLHEIYELQLPAELVVLSACRTALGKEVRGEGLLGLPRGFFYAGAARVLVSLWNVHDEGTAELMVRFYHHLLGEGLSPAAALRAAQRSMLAEARYAPYHWAGFVLQGDWR